MQRRGAADGHHWRSCPNHKRLGATLVRGGVLDHDRLEAALERQSAHGGLLGQVLTRTGLCSRNDIRDALLRQRIITSVRLIGVSLDDALRELFSRDACAKGGFVPFERFDGALCVAMANVLDAGLKQTIKDRCGTRLLVFDSSAEHISAAIDALYSAGGDERDGLCERSSE